MSNFTELAAYSFGLEAALTLDKTRLPESEYPEITDEEFTKINEAIAKTGIVDAINRYEAHMFRASIELARDFAKKYTENLKCTKPKEQSNTPVTPQVDTV